MPAPAVGAAAMRLLGFFGKGGKGTAALEALDAVKKGVNAVSKSIDALKGNWDELNDIAFKTARTMALSREQAEAFNQQLMTSTKELAAQFGITAKEIAEFQKNYAEAVGRNIILTKEQISHMAALSKITDSATAQKLVDEFDKVGAGIARATAYTGRLQERAKALGVSPSKATKMMADNIKLAASYSFRNGVNDIEKMALKAAGLRLEMSQVASALDKFQNIEDAITNSAELQLLGGSIGAAFSNPMAVMYQAKADPEAFMENIVNSLKGKGTYDEKTGTVKFDPVTLDIMKAAAKTLGMSAEQLSNTAMASVQNEKVKQELEENGAAGRFTDKELELLQNLSRTNVNDNGKHFVTFFKDGREQTKEISDLTNEELQIAKDSQMTEEQMFDDVQQIKEILERVHGRARETVSYKEQKEGWSEWWATARADVADIFYKPFARVFNTVTNAVIGKQYFSTGGIAKPLHAAEGTIVPGDSYTGDKVPAMLNSGEMVLNPMQQKSMFNMIQSLALRGGMFYGMNKIGGKMGVGGIGSTMLLANVLGGEDTGISEIIEAHYLKKFLKSLSPFKKSIEGIGEVAETAAEQTNTFGTRWSELTDTLSSDWKSLTKKVSGATKKFFTTGRLGKVTNGVSQAASFIKGKASSYGRTSKKFFTTGKGGRIVSGVKTATTAISGKASSYGRVFASNAKLIGEQIGKYTVKPLAKVGKSIIDSKPVVGARGWAETKYYRGKLGYRDFKDKVFKPKSQEYSRLIKNLFNDGSKAQASKAASRLQTPEIAMTGRKTGVVKQTVSKATESAKSITSTLKNSKALGYVGKAGKVLGKVAKPINTVLSVAGAVSGIAGAKSEYDKKVEELNGKNMSAKDKAIAKDKAEKERNTTIGTSVGKTAGNIGGWAAGAATGAAIGSIIPVAGTAIGGLIGLVGGLIGSHYGEKALGWVGGKVGGMFGGNNAEKFEKPAHAQEGLIVPGNSYTGDKVPIKANSGEMILDQNKQKNLFSMLSNPISSTVKALPDLSSFMKVLPPVALASAAAKTVGIGKSDINLHVSGTIKLEGNGKSADIDIAKLLDTPEFKRQLTDMLTKSMNENSNAGKYNKESSWGNMANQWNKTGK